MKFRFVGLNPEHKKHHWLWMGGGSGGGDSAASSRLAIVLARTQNVVEREKR